MKAKIVLILSFLILAAAAGLAAPNFEITLRVVDDFNKPVQGAKAGVATFERWDIKPGEGFGEDIYRNIYMVTDTNGEAVIKSTSREANIKYGINPMPGYYYTTGGDCWFKQSEGGKWQPWNPVVELVLRPILNPVPMYARKVKTRIPTPSRKYGYDLVASDWVAPEGKGKVTDLVFELSGYANSVKDYDSTLTVSFANPMDGIQPFVPIKGSDFRSPREAPLDGYQAKLELRRVRLPGQLSPEWIDDTQKATNYFFRIRTVSDENGKIKSALYGKIYGGFGFFGASTNGSFLTIHAI